MTHIQVVIPAYNCEAYIERCLRSVGEQTYGDFDVLMIDDASSDNTWRIMERAARAGRWDARYNPENLKMPHNLVHAREGDSDDVVFLLDGDDYLPHPEVLTTVAELFDDGDLWLSYGSYTRDPDPTWMPNPAGPYPDWVVEQRAFRAYSSLALVYNHPLIFRRWLFNEVTDGELHDDEGHWFTRCYDHVIMMPMLELAAEHFMWCPEVLYVYNEENPTSEAKDPTARAEADRIHRQVNARLIRAALA